MPVNEIEIPGTSLSLRCLSFKCEVFDQLFEKIQEEGDAFSIEPEKYGFHDCDHDDQVVRGFFSIIVAFEVEHLVDGIVTKTLLKRIETCEFVALENLLYVSGKTSAQKILEHTLAGLTGYGVTAMEFEFRHLSQFQERLSTMKSIALTNPKDREIRRVRMAGKMETYTEYNVIDAKNHGIEVVTGTADTPLGPLNITVGRKGTIKLSVKRGFILSVDCLNWILALVREEKPPQKTDFQKHTDRLQGIVKKLDSDLKKTGSTMTLSSGDSSVTLGKKLDPETIKEVDKQIEGLLEETGITWEKGAKV